MGDRARASVVTALRVFAVLLATMWVAACAGPSRMSADGAPIIVKNQKLEVILLSEDSEDVWVPDGHGEYQPSKSQRVRPDLIVLATKSNGTGCKNQPFRADWVKFTYGTSTSVAKTVMLHVAGKKVKVNFPGAAGQGTKILEFKGQTSDFLYRVQGANNGDTFDCTTDGSTPMIVNVFEVNY